MRKKQVEKIRTTGRVISTIQEGSTLEFIVDVELGNDIVRAISVPYSSKSGGIEIIDKKVMVNYWIWKNGEKRVEILDEGMIECKDDLKGELTVLICWVIAAIIVCTICIVTGR